MNKSRQPVKSRQPEEKMELTLSQVAAVLGVELIGEDRVFSQVSINTRSIEKGDLFVAIKGENFDAHEYLAQAEEKGACGLVVEQSCSSVLPQIQVKNTRAALGDIASLWSSAFTLPIVAITGSCGKTTVKEMTAAILGHGYKTSVNKSGNNEGYEHILATRGNLNNDIGVPLTLLRLNKTHNAAVVELGANHIGEIKQLVDMVQPNVALITNVAHAHIEGFGSIEGVAQAKSEIYTGLESGGTAIINADDTFADYWQKQCLALNKEYEKSGQHEAINVLTFGLEHTSDISAEYKQLNDGIELMIKTPIGDQAVKLNQFGRHNVYNALAATAAAISADCTLDDVKKGLEDFKNVSGRLEQKNGIQGAVIFDDTYNANPGSVRAGIEAIQQIDGEAVLILGDIAELGKESKALHYQLGIDAANMGIKQLFTVGSISQETCNGFLSISENNHSDELRTAMHFRNKEELIQGVQNILNKKKVVLIKGSRTMGMETVVDALLDSSQLNKNKKEGIQ